MLGMEKYVYETALQDSHDGKYLQFCPCVVAWSEKFSSN